jgi:D-amino peptidase
MKVYISADIEGVAGIAHWDEATKSESVYQEFREQMTQEGLAAGQGAVHSGATEILIKDAHWTGRNILTSQLPEEARLIRGWSHHPFAMVQELDETFHAVIMVGYHSGAGLDTNPLAHTITTQVTSIKINGGKASEFLLNTYAATLVNVPVIFVSGDAGLCQEVATLNEQIKTVAVSEGIGESVITIAPQLALKRIREGVERALKGDTSSCKIRLPEHFQVEIQFKDHMKAYKASFYPGASQTDPESILFETNEYFEVLRMLMFTL